MCIFLIFQYVIQNFAVSFSSSIIPKRVKLLLIPLKTNNCKTEELVKMKHQTWCTLFNALSDEKYHSVITSFPVLETYLNFCYGQLGETPFLSYTQNNALFQQPGKKFPSLHLEMCMNFLKLIAKNSIMDRAPDIHLDMTFEKPLITTTDFVKKYTKSDGLDLYSAQVSRLIIYSVGEASVLLSNWPDFKIAVQVNELLWEAVLDLIDSVVSPTEHLDIIEEFCVVVLDLIEVCIFLFEFIVRKSKKYMCIQISLADLILY